MAPGRKLIMVLLDSAGKYSRIGDAERVRRCWSEPPSAGDQPRRPRLIGLALIGAGGQPP